jgi:hypothetical protein
MTNRKLSLKAILIYLNSKLICIDSIRNRDNRICLVDAQDLLRHEGPVSEAVQKACILGGRQYPLLFLSWQTPRRYIARLILSR